MSIPASYIVDVQPRVINGGSANLEFNGLVLSRNEIISSDTLVLSFTSANTVGEYFGILSKEYEAAQVYFNGYVNKFSGPRAFLVARYIDDIIASWVRSAPNSHTLEEYKAITNGSIEVTIDGTAYSIENVDFSTATSLSDVGELLAAAIASNGGADDGPAVTCIYSSLNRSFTLESPTLGEDSSVTFPENGATGTGLATYFGFTEAQGAIHSSGSGAQNINQIMAAIRAKTENWVSYTTLDAPDSDEIMELAAWASANYGWLYVAYSEDPTIPSQEVTTDPASLLIQNQYDHTAIVYGGVEYAVFIMGSVASISWARLNGTITLAFKRQSGLAAYVTDESVAAALDAKRCNYIGNFATRNAEFVFLYASPLSASDYNFIDPYVNSIWLNNRFQVALMDGLTSIGRAPYNERGYTMIRAWMQDPINEGLNNAAIEPGISLSESQKSQLFNEAGTDISEDLETNGFYLQVLDPTANVRAARDTPVINFWYTYGGAIQKIEVASTLIQ